MASKTESFIIGFTQAAAVFAFVGVLYLADKVRKLERNQPTFTPPPAE